MKALIVGATGAVGKDLLEQLLGDDAFDSIEIFVRREVKTDSPKLKVHVVDFERMDGWKRLLSGDVLFSCLGTTIKAAGSKEVQWKVDYTYQLEAAKAAREAGVTTYVLVSAIGASPKAKFFYTRMKGELDEEVIRLGFPRCVILRPPSLIRKGSDRFGEKVGVAALKAFNSVGLLRSYRPMPTEEVAAAMIRAAKGESAGVQIIESQDILTT